MRVRMHLRERHRREQGQRRRNEGTSQESSQLSREEARGRDNVGVMLIDVRVDPAENAGKRCTQQWKLLALSQAQFHCHSARVA